MKIARNQAIVLYLILLTLPACNPFGHNPPDIAKKMPVVARKVLVATLQSKAVIITRRYACKINARRHIEVNAPVDGYIEAIPIRDGQAVKRDELLFKLVPIVRVVPVGGMKKLEFTVIKASFDGVIDRVPYQPGSLVQKGETLTTLYDNSVMWVYFDIPETHYLEHMVEADQNHQSPEIELILADGGKYPQTGKIGAIEAKFNNPNGDIAFRADFPNPDGLLHHGQTGTVLIHRVLKDAVVIPQRATHEILDKRYVFRIDKEGVAHRREIVIRNELDDQFVVKTGIDAGDKIVLDEMSRIHDGDKTE
jgi:membrane fusion protein, multidrug efflux system